MKRKLVLVFIIVLLLFLGVVLYNQNTSYAAPANIPKIAKVEKSTLEENTLVVFWDPNNDGDDFSIEIYNRKTDKLKKFAGSKTFVSYAFRNQPDMEHYGFMIRACMRYSNCTKWSEVFDENSVYEDKENIDDTDNNTNNDNTNNSDNDDNNTNSGNDNNEENNEELSDEKEADILLEKVSFDTSKLSLYVGNSYDLLLSYFPANATNIKGATWSSSNTNVAAVSNGTVTAKGAGTAVITAKVNDKSTTCTVTVTSKNVSLTLNKTQLVLNTGGKATIVATHNSSKTVTWKSSNTSVATVSGGTVTAKKGGNSTITAIVDGKSATCKVVVKSPLKSIKLNKTKATLHYGKKLDLNVTYSPSDTTDSKKATWKSSNTKIATVNSSGVVTAKGHGTATITAKVGSKTATCKITAQTNQGKVLSAAEAEYTVWSKFTKSQKCYREKNYYLKSCSKDQKGFYGHYCAGFVSYVMKKAGLNHYSKSKNYCLARQWYDNPGLLSGGKKHGLSYTPKPGDLIVWEHHIGIVKKVNGKKLTTIEGNTTGAGNSISCGGYSLGNVNHNRSRTKGEKLSSGKFLGFVSYNK